MVGWKIFYEYFQNFETIILDFNVSPKEDYPLVLFTLSINKYIFYLGLLISIKINSRQFSQNYFGMEVFDDPKRNVFNVSKDT